jgi:hypothetical protein
MNFMKLLKRVASYKMLGTSDLNMSGRLTHRTIYVSIVGRKDKRQASRTMVLRIWSESAIGVSVFLAVSSWFGSAIAQAVSRRAVTAEALVRDRVVSCGICVVHKVALGEVLSPWLSLVTYHISRAVN